MVRGEPFVNEEFIGVCFVFSCSCFKAVLNYVIYSTMFEFAFVLSFDLFVDRFVFLF